MVIQTPLTVLDIIYLKDMKNNKVVDVPTIEVSRIKQVLESINHNIDHLEPRSPQKFKDMQELFKGMINEKIQL